MPTFKVVVIDPSDVGKTSLRCQYISARFSTPYRATIADSIKRTLPLLHPAGSPWCCRSGTPRARSASPPRSSAAVLMCDLTNAGTLYALEGWWTELRVKAHVGDVGGGVGGNERGVISAAQDACFVRALVPRVEPPPLPSAEADKDDADAGAADTLASSQLTAHPSFRTRASRPPPQSQSSHTPARTGARSELHAKNPAQTMTSMLTVYHMASSVSLPPPSPSFYSGTRPPHRLGDSTTRGLGSIRSTCIPNTPSAGLHHGILHPQSSSAFSLISPGSLFDVLFAGSRAAVNVRRRPIR
ncbi:hypothetical protein FB451DRAFT_1550935 [Mycena latifolia]|nr:hypothetical protein FB451DRAFT_1550935 [Mycena latifolia]